MSDRTFVGTRERVKSTVWSDVKQQEEEIDVVRAVVRIHEEGRPVRELTHHVLHAPGGFDWGTEGAGPADLALALLAEACDEVATVKGYLERREFTETSPESMRLHQLYKRRIVSKFKPEGFTIDEVRVSRWVAAARRRDDASVR